MLWGLIGLAAAVGTQQAPVPADHVIRLMVVKEVMGDTAHAGEPVKLVVAEPAVIGGIPVPAGTRAVGEVVSAGPSGLAMKRGMVSIRVTRLLLPAGDVPLSGMLSTEGHGGRNDSAWKVLLAPMYAPFARGHAARFKAGEVLTLPVDDRAPAAGQ